VLESTDDPSLKKFLDFRFQNGVLEDKKRSTLSTKVNWKRSKGTILKRPKTGKNTPSSTTLPIAVGSGKRLRSVGEHALDKKSQSLISFWDLQTKRQTIHMNSKVLEEEAQLQQNELKNQIHIEQQIEKDLLNELYAKNENLEEEAPSTLPDKVRI
ncbi:10431_t:CDS:2, partial [Scutellospora calospora]